MLISTLICLLKKTPLLGACTPNSELSDGAGDNAEEECLTRKNMKAMFITSLIL